MDPSPPGPPAGRPPFAVVVRWLAGFSLGALAWLAVSAVVILWEPSQGQEPRRADVIVVLGAAAYGRVPSPVLRERLRHALALYQKGVAPTLLFTGGRQLASDLSEAEVARLWCKENGVPDGAMLIEDRSRSTVENLINARELMRVHGLRRAVLVSDPLHLARARLIGERLGLRIQTSATPTTRFRSLSTQLPFLIRECYFYTTTLLGLAR